MFLIGLYLISHFVVIGLFFNLLEEIFCANPGETGLEKI